jgi:hypothetical protein
VIFDLFHGQFGAHVACSVCPNRTTKFEPFSFISLPLPLNKKQAYEVRLYRAGGNMPFLVGARIPHDGTVEDLKLRVEKVKKIIFLFLFFLKFENSVKFF